MFGACSCAGHINIILWIIILHLYQSSFKFSSRNFNSEFFCAHIKSGVVAVHVRGVLAENLENSSRMRVLYQISSFLKREFKKIFFSQFTKAKQTYSLKGETSDEH